MEQHPVPRNISGFQFKLIGDMTLKQFGYLAGGAALGFIIFKSVPLPSLFKFIFAGIPAFAGFLFAFLPIQERPLDKWVVLFIKSIYAPTQFLWLKEGNLPSVLLMPTTTHIRVLPATHAAANEDARKKLNSYLASIPIPLQQQLNKNEKSYLDKTLSLFDSIPVSYTPPIQIKPIPAAPLPTPEPLPQVEVKPAITQVQSSLIQNESIPAMQPPVSDDDSMQKKLQSLSAEKDLLTKELEMLKRSVQPGSLHANDSVVVKPVISDETQPTIKTISPKNAVNEVGLPSLSTYPNLIVGVVKDGERRVLPNILITIKDKNGVPLRAFKTNKLGQFASATPLPNGLYFIEIEDPLKRYTFDIAEITLSGKVFLPIEVSAKSQKEVMREQLSKVLFGNQAA